MSSRRAGYGNVDPQGVLLVPALFGLLFFVNQLDEHTNRLGVDGAVDDQRAGATLMWVTGMAVTVPLLFAAVWRWASTEERMPTGRDRHA